MLKNILKKSIIYQYIYRPYKISQINKISENKHKLLRQEGRNLLASFIQCCKIHNIPYWLEFGTLLGAYRDGDFIKNDTDIDVGVFLEHAHTLYNALTSYGFNLVREFHVVGENGLEQTYEYHGVTIDIMYFYKQKNLLWCNGVNGSPQITQLARYRVTAHYFYLFNLTEIDFLGLKVSVPENTEEHLREVFGNSFMKYDPNFSGDLNKEVYPMTEKSAIGFIYY